MSRSHHLAFIALLLVLVTLAALMWRPVASVPARASVDVSTASRPVQACTRSMSRASHELRHCPTVTASFIDRVLFQSPARGLGKVMYQEGVKRGIDPAYALAFYHHESDYGLYGVARVSLSLGNIRCTPGYQCIEGYRAYASYAAAVIDWYTLIATVYLASGLMTVEQIIPVYAPSIDHNDEGAYIASVNTDVMRWREGQV